MLVSLFLSCMALAGSIEADVKEKIGGEAQITNCEIEYFPDSREAWLQLESNIQLGGGNATVLFTSFAQPKCVTSSAGFSVLEVDNAVLARVFILWHDEIINSQIEIGNTIFDSMRKEDGAWDSYCAAY